MISSYVWDKRGITLALLKGKWKTSDSVIRTARCYRSVYFQKHPLSLLHLLPSLHPLSHWFSLFSLYPLHIPVKTFRLSELRAVASSWNTVSWICVCAFLYLLQIFDQISISQWDFPPCLKLQPFSNPSYAPWLLSFLLFYLLYIPNH